MKKTLIILLASVLALGLFGCSSNDADKELIRLGTLTNVGTTEARLAETINNENPDTTKLTITFFDDLTTMLLALDKGDVDSASLATPVANYISGQNVGKYSVTDQTKYNFYYAMALPQENQELLNTLNDALDTLDANGTLNALEREYILNAGSLPIPEDLPTYADGQTVRVVVTGDLPPMDYATADGLAAGYNVALLTAIAEETHINFELVSASAGSRPIMISSGKADLLFWTKGIAQADRDEPDYSFDLPKGMMTTRSYMTTGNSWLAKK